MPEKMEKLIEESREYRKRAEALEESTVIITRELVRVARNMKDLDNRIARLRYDFDTDKERRRAEKGYCDV